MNSKLLTLPQQIADEIKEMIIKKELKIGDKLPNENIFSKHLNVSRATLREGIKILISQNILEIKRGKGTYVISDICDNNNLKDLNNIVHDLKDLLELRLIIEPMATYYAAKRASDKEIEKIIKVGLQIEEKIQNKEDRTKEEQSFHNLIAKASHNTFIKDLVPILNEAIHKAVLLAKEFNTIDEITLRDHKLIMEYLKNRNPNGAKVSMELHIINAMAEFKIQRD